MLDIESLPVPSEKEYPIMKYELTIKIGTIEADSLEDAKKKAYKKLEIYAGSNDGSELFANAQPILREIS